MRGGERRFQFAARDVHVRFEGVGTHASPILYESASVIGSVQLSHLWRKAAVSLEVTHGDEHLGAGHPAIVDHFFDVEVGVRFERSGGARGGYTRGQIQPGEAHPMLDIERDSTTRR